MRTNLAFFVTLLIIFTGCTSKNNLEWVTWRGPFFNSVSPDSSLDPEKLDSLSIKWKIDIGFGHSAICVQGNNCFASGWKEIVSEKDTSQLLSIYCIDVETGQERWKSRYPAKMNRFPGPRSTPVIDADRLYSINWDGKMVCLNTTNGSEIWSLDLAADSLAVWDDWGFNTSPVISDDLILLNLNKTGLALNKFTGEKVWSGKFGVSSWSSVYLTNIGGATNGIFQSDTTMFLVNIETGEVLSSYHKKSDGAINNEVVQLTENRIYTSDEMLELNENVMVPIWYNDSIASFFRTGVVIGDYSYQFSDSKGKNFLYCVDLKTGEPKWRQDMLGRWGNLMAVGNYLVILETFGKVVIAEANPEKYNPIKEMQVLSDDPIQDNFCWVAPTFVNGRLYIRNSKGELACIDLSK